MVDVNNIPQINSLMQSYINYRQALDVIDGDGAIASFSLTGRRGSATVPAGDIDYPPQMIDAIRERVIRRVENLERDLADLGVDLNGAYRR